MIDRRHLPSRPASAIDDCAGVLPGRGGLFWGEMIVGARSRRSIFNWSGAVGTFVAVGLSFVTSANAQIQRDVDRCTGKDSVTPELQIRSCTAVIESKAYAGKELAFAFNNRGLAYYDKRDFERAIASYTEAISVDPKFAPGYNNRALAHKARGDLDHAIADYSEALRLDPNNASTLRSRGIVYSTKQDYERAIADYAEAI